MSSKKNVKKMDNEALGFFAKYLTVWVALCIAAGVILGQVLPILPETLSKFEYANVSIPVAILIWLIKPFTMYAIAAFFFYIVFKALIPAELAKEYLAGAVLLGAAPCTAMVFVWSHLTKGDPAYTLVQVAVNDLILLAAFTPIVAFLLGVSDVAVPYDTLFLSVILFVVILLAGGYFSRKYVIKNKGLEA